MSDFFMHTLPVLLPLFALQFDISYSQSALIFTVFSVMSYILQPLIGIWADRRNITKLLPITISLAALLVSLVGWFNSYTLLICVLLLSGLCSSFFHPLSAGVIPSIFPQKARGLATSVYIAGGNAGAALAPLVTAAFISLLSEQYLILLALPAFATSLLMVSRNLHHRVLSAPRQGKGRENEVSFLALVRSRDFVLLNLSICLRAWPHCALITFLPLLYASLNFSTVDGATALVLLLTGAVAGGLLAGALTDYCSLRRILLCSYALIILFCFIFLSHPDNTLLSYVLLFCSGGALYAAIPVGVVWGQRLMPQHASFAGSMMMGFSFGAGFVLTPLTGLMADHSNLTDALMYSALPPVVIALIILLFVHEPRTVTKLV